MRGITCTAALAVLVSGLAGLPAAADPVGNQDQPAVPELVRTVTLITGDKVTATRHGGTWQAHVEPARRAGTPTGFIKSAGPGGVTVIPEVALPLVRSGQLDRALFDVTQLIELGYDDASTAEIPLLVEGPGVAALGSVRRELAAAGLSAVATPKARATEVFEIAKTRKVWLNGKVFPSLDQSVRQVGAPAAWDAGYTGAGATIAVLDTGYDTTHPDLAGIVKAEKDFTGEGVKDTVGHGTHVASTAAGRGTASAGKYTGVAKGANLLVGKVCAARGCPFDAVLEGMQWAADNGAKVVNMSLGGRAGDGTDPLELAVNRISAQQGTLFVIAAGNGGKVQSPAAADAALAVASVDKQDQMSAFSSYGPRIGDFAVKPDIAAPGEDIVAARAKGTLDPVAVNEHYARMEGTSMATPHVAGAAAILAAQHPGWTGQQIKEALMASANPINATIYHQGTGRLDVARAVSQTVTASPASLSMGFVGWPHNTDKVTKQVTYRNWGTAPVTLDLDLQDADVFSTDVKQITVAAQGEAKVDVTFDPTRGPAAELTGRLIARNGGTVVQTAIGATKEPESYTLTVKLIDRDGVELQPNGSGVVMWNQIGSLEGDLVASNEPVRLPKGRYSVTGYVDTAIPGRFEPAQTLVAEPEIDMSRDTTVVLDARKANKVSVQVDENDARAIAGVTSIGSSGLSYFTYLNDNTYALPTQGNHPHLTYHNRIQLGRPEVRLMVTGPESFDIPVEWAPESPNPLGAKDYEAVDVGNATPGEIAARDLKGKLAVFTLRAGEGGEYDARVEALATAGAAAVMFHFTDTRIHVDATPPVPVVHTTDPAGSRLAKLKDASVTLTGQGPSPYRYELAFPHRGAVPANLDYRPKKRELTTVKANYHASIDRGKGSVYLGTRSGGIDMGSGLAYTTVPLPFQRTEYYSPVTWHIELATWVGTNPGGGQRLASPWRDYKAGERISRDWSRAVLGPNLTPAPRWETDQPHLAYRHGDTVSLALAMFSDASGHTGRTLPEDRYVVGDTGQTVLYADGKEVGRSTVAGEGTFTVPQGAKDYRLTADVHRPGPGWPMSTNVSSDWTFRSTTTDKATPLPLLTVGFSPKVDLNNYAVANGVHAVPVRVDRQAGATGGATSLQSVEVSTDDGATWRRVAVIKVHDRWLALIPNPSAGFVSLRANAADKDGNSVKQTIIRAYRVR